jgi:hypothetical protein
VPAPELLIVGYGGRQPYPQECTATPATGDHLHAQARIVHLEESLAQLVFQNELGREDAIVRSLHPEDLDVLLKAKGF